MTLLFPAPPLLRQREKIVVGFAGGGGTCTGIAEALGRSPDDALNHDPVAVAMHAVNHPGTKHWCQNIWQADPAEVADGRAIGLAWFSPDCKHFSKAKGTAPKARHIRDLAWVVVSYARLPRHIRPRVVMVENVEEFRTWGPLLADGQPDQKRKGETFAKWLAEMKRLGYRAAFRESRACDYGAPTIRKRLLVIFRCDGERIVWPEPTHGAPDSAEVRAGQRLPWHTAAEIIDWSIPCPSIFARSRPLAEATLRRIANGLRRYVVEHASPFIIPVTHSGGPTRGHGLDEPVRTVTAAHRGEMALIAPYISTYYGAKNDRDARGCSADGLLGTQTTENRHALCAAFLAQHNTGVIGRPVDAPLSTVMATGSQQAVTVGFLSHLYGSNAAGGGGDPRAPLKTVTAGGEHHAAVHAFLTKYYGTGGQDQDVRAPLHTIPTHDRFGLVTVAGETWEIADIGMRMLSPRELFRAQGFPDSTIIDFEFNGKPLPKSAQVRLCGNSVCPPWAAAHVAANCGDLAAARVMEAAE